MPDSIVPSCHTTVAWLYTTIASATISSPTFGGLGLLLLLLRFFSFLSCLGEMTRKFVNKIERFWKALVFFFNLEFVEVKWIFL